MSNSINKVDNININESTNVVHLLGTILDTPVYSHTYDDIRYYSVRLKVNRNNSNNKYDNIHVFLPEIHLVIDSKILDNGVRIKVVGRLVQSELRDMSDISVVADKVSLAELDSKDENQIYISGVIHRLYELHSIKDTQKVLKQMILKHTTITEKGPRNLTVKASCWNNTGKLVDEKYHEGDKIMIRGQLLSKLVKAKNSTDKQNSTVMLHEANVAVIIDLNND